MQRPVIYAAVCFSLAAAVGTKTELLGRIWPAAWLAVIGAAILIGGFHPAAERAVPVLVLGALPFLYISGYQRLFVKPAEALCSQGTLAVRAVVLDYADIYEENQRVPLWVTAIGKDAPESPDGWNPRVFKTMCYLPLSEELWEPGDTVEAHFVFYKPDIRDGFERQSYYASNGYFVLARQAEDTPIHWEKRRSPVWWSYPLRTARVLKQSVSMQLPEREAGFLNAILFGDRSGLDAADERNLRKAGLSHMTAVSGMHVSFLVTFLCIAISKKIGTMVSIFAILFFIPMAGASPSIIRAAVMHLVAAVSFLFFLGNDGFNAMAAALIVLLLLNPYAISSASLLLSFGAALGLMLFSGRLNHWLLRPFLKKSWPVRKAIGAAVSAVSCSLCTMVFTTPVLLVLFGYITVISPVANLFTLAALGAAFVLGMVIAVLGLTHPSVCAPIAMVEEKLLTYVLAVGDWVAHLPFGVLSWGDLLGKIAILGIYAGFIFLFAIPRKDRLYRFLTPMCLLLAGCSLLSAKQTRDSTRLAILPCGTGQTLIYCDGPEALTVIDCGSDQAHDSADAVIEFLDWNGYTEIDTLILTAVDQAHARSAAKLLRTGLVHSLVFPKIPKSRQKELYQEVLAAAKEYQVPYSVGIPAELPEGIALFDEVERKFLVRITLGGRRVLTVHSLTPKMLAEFLEDSDVKAEVLLLSEQNTTDAELLRAALEAIQPESLVLECGYMDNESLLRRRCHNTKLEGEIILRETKGGELQWQ